MPQRRSLFLSVHGHCVPFKRADRFGLVCARTSFACRAPRHSMHSLRSAAESSLAPWASMNSTWQRWCISAPEGQGLPEDPWHLTSIPIFFSPQLRRKRTAELLRQPPSMLPWLRMRVLLVLERLPQPRSWQQLPLRAGLLLQRSAPLWKLMLLLLLGRSQIWCQLLHQSSRHPSRQGPLATKFSASLRPCRMCSSDRQCRHRCIR